MSRHTDRPPGWTDMRSQLLRLNINITSEQSRAFYQLMRLVSWPRSRLTLSLGLCSQLVSKEDTILQCKALSIPKNSGFQDEDFIHLWINIKYYLTNRQRWKTMCNTNTNKWTKMMGRPLIYKLTQCWPVFCLTSSDHWRHYGRGDKKVVTGVILILSVNLTNLAQ